MDKGSCGYGWKIELLIHLDSCQPSPSYGSSFGVVRQLQSGLSKGKKNLLFTMGLEKSQIHVWRGHVYGDQRG